MNVIENTRSPRQGVPSLVASSMELDSLMPSDGQLALTAAAVASSVSVTRGPNALWQPPKGRNYLLRAGYRKLDLLKMIGKGEDGVRDYLATIRWGEHGANKQVCPSCGSIDTHYWCGSVARWKCREKACGKQFTVFSGTRFHNQKMSAVAFLSLLHHFIEAKDSISARELSGLHDLNHQTAHVFTLKLREAVRETMMAEPMLDGYVQADAAYFMKYQRPGNVGTGASFAAKSDRKNAGLDENGKVAQTVSPKMHALVVFVQSAQQGRRRYKVAVVKTENQVDMLALGQLFCTQDAMLVTDQHKAYNFYSGEFDAHFCVNHSEEFMTSEGFHTNHAEGFFARMRAAQGGAWHKLTLQYLEEYGWEFAWRQTMVGRSNLEQLEDLLQRVLNTGRATRFADYWGTRPERKPKPSAEDVGLVMAVSKDGVKKKRGRPALGTVRPQEPEKAKRPYRKRGASKTADESTGS